MENMSYLNFSKKWAGYLGRKTDLSREKEIVLTYIIELMAITLINIICTLVLGLLLGVLPGTASCLFMIALFRHTAGGAHSNSPWRCAVITILIFPLIALLAGILSLLANLYTDILSIILILVGLVTIIRLAPVDTSAAPIISSSRRKDLKFSSVIVILIVAVVVFVLRQSTWIYAREIQLSLIIGVLWLCLILSKPGHRLIFWIDKLFSFKKEVGENEKIIT
jgi:accessory gene regulator B